MQAHSPDVRVLRALRSGDRQLREIPNLGSHIDRLRASGYQIDDEFRLLAAPSHLIADDLRASLPENATIGREIIVVRETNSTNDLAAKAGNDGVGEGLTVFAESQRAGRGTHGRAWESPPGLGLWFSVLLRPALAEHRWAELTFCAALAVAQAAEAVTACPARIKWPNDVLLNGRKVAGILVEVHRRSAGSFAVVGIGLNVSHRHEDFPRALQSTATSLSMTAALPIDRRIAAVRVLEQLEHLYRDWAGGFASIQAACAQRGGYRPS